MLHHQVWPTKLSPDPLAPPTIWLAICYSGRRHHALLGKATGSAFGGRTAQSRCCRQPQYNSRRPVTIGRPQKSAL